MPYYTPTGKPANQSRGLASEIRYEFQLIEAAFNNIWASPAFTGTPTVPTPSGSASPYQIVNIAYLTSAIVAATIPGGSDGQVMTKVSGVPAWAYPSLLVTPVTGTTQTAVVGKNYILNNVAATAVTAPTSFAAGDPFAVSPNNGLLTNTIDFGAKTVRGPAGTATGVVTLNAGAPMELVAIDSTTWMML